GCSLLSAHSDFLTAFAGGYGGLPLHFSALALLIVLHAGYVFVRSLCTLVGRCSEIPDPTNAAIATMLLVWFPYYANRPDPWNLWTFTALYSLMILKLVKETRYGIIPLAIFATLVLPVSIDFAKDQVYDSLGMAHPFRVHDRFVLGWHQGCADGLVVPDEICESLNTRASTLRNLAGDGSILWLTAFPMLTMRMSGLQS